MNNKLSAKYKIYIAVAGFFVVSGLFFGYLYSILQKSSETIALRIFEKDKEYKSLQSEQLSYEAGKKDLAELEELPTKPADLFSQDVRLVKEIKTLEDLAKGSSLTMTFSISGTAAEAKKAPKSIANIYFVPYVMNVTGSYQNIVRFMEQVEYVPFVTHFQEVSMTALEGGEVRGSFVGNFFIKK